MENWLLNRRRLALLLALGVAVVAMLVGAYLAYERWFPWEQTEIEEWIDGFGVWGPIVYIVVFALSMLFAPLPTAPMPLIAAAVFGPALGFLYTISATAIGSTICFWVARRLGRPVLSRLASPRALDKIDELGARLGMRLLIVLRLFPCRWRRLCVLRGRTHADAIRLVHRYLRACLGADPDFRHCPGRRRVGTQPRDPDRRVCGDRAVLCRAGCLGLVATPTPGTTSQVGALASGHAAV